MTGYNEMSVGFGLGVYVSNLVRGFYDGVANGEEPPYGINVPGSSCVINATGFGNRHHQLHREVAMTVERDTTSFGNSNAACPVRHRWTKTAVLAISAAALAFFACQPRPAARGTAKPSNVPDTTPGWIEPDSIALKGPHVVRVLSGTPALPPPISWLRAQGQKVGGTCGRFRSPEMVGASGQRRAFTRVSFDSVTCAAVYAVGDWTPIAPGKQDSLSVRKQIPRRDTNP